MIHIKSKILRIIKKIDNKYTFPILVISSLILLSSLSISGTSIGIYKNYFDDQGAVDKNLIAGTPKGIRSDEWLVNSQMTIAQYKSGLPYINNNIGEGQNMSLVADVPYLEWSILFKPQNLIFFIAPLEFAFAFKWWFLLALLVLSVYYFALEIMPNKHKTSALLATLFAVSPFVHWWYQTITIAPLFYSFFILTCLIRLHKAIDMKNKITYSIILSYLLTAFALVMYPPFQIPCVVVSAFLYISLLIEIIKQKNDNNIKQSLWLILSSIILSITITATFILTRINDIQTILNTAYPGKRVVISGDFPLIHTLSNFLAPFFQYEKDMEFYKLGTLATNQSESANFTLPFAIILAMSLLVSFIVYIKNKKISFGLISISLVSILFLLRMSVIKDPLVNKILLIESIPDKRLIIGLGMACIILMIYLIKTMSSKDFTLSNNLKWIVVLTSCFIYSWLIVSVILSYPGLITHTHQAIGILIVFTLFTWLFIFKHYNLSIIVLIVFSILSISKINPLYIGVDYVNNTKLASLIQDINNKNPKARWIVDNNIYIENYASSNGAPTLSGVYQYPQKNIFSQIANSPDDEKIYNRYAHVVFNVNTDQIKPQLKLLQADSFEVKISPCDAFLTKYNVKYIISAKDITSSCLSKEDSVKITNSELYIYKINN